ncbi:rhamnulokinase family protein [Georgenia sp. TF02-10]|uniref:rhamnulokinase n=1 Tax=Georgenia sp. TF02-10 TaxID=2917725 RepID=UPI00352F2B01
MSATGSPGERVAEVTNASTTGLLDVRRRTWSTEVTAALERDLGVPAAGLLPDLVEPGTVLGPLDPGDHAEVVAGTRLVAVGSHDTASAVAAVPATEPGFAYISCGTWSLVGLELPAPVTTEASRAANFTNELGLDGTVRYLRNVMGLWLLQESLRTWHAGGHDVDLATLLAQAAEVPPLRCVIDVDDPAFLPPGGMPARITAAAASTGQPPPTTPAEVTRCIVDSLAPAHRRAVHQAAELADREVTVVHVVGGGSRNALLCQLTADATGLPVLAGPAEATALGNILVQARATRALNGGLVELRRAAAQAGPVHRYEPTGSVDRWAQAEARLVSSGRPR